MIGTIVLIASELIATEFCPTVPFVHALRIITQVAFVYEDRVPEVVMILEIMIHMIVRIIVDRFCRHAFVFRV
jgi:hypothetical protein